MNVLLLRGLVREQRHWGDFPKTLEDAWPGARTHFLDLPGAGTECLKSCPWTVPEMTRDVRSRFVALREQHRDDHPWMLVGISLGGMIALEWSAQFPDDFVCSVVINTSASNLSRPWDRFAWRNYPRILRSMTQSDLLERERAVIDMTINRSDLDRDALAHSWAEFARERPVLRATIVRQLAAGARARVERHKSRRALIVNALGDRLVSPACSAAIAHHLQAPLISHPTGGHDLPIDDGPWLANQIRDFAQSS